MPIKPVALIRQLVRGLRIASVVAAFALTSAAYADPLYLFTLTLNHTPIYAPYGGDISSLSWTLPDPTTSSSPVGPGIEDQPTLQAQSLCSGGYCPSQDEMGYFMTPFFANPGSQDSPTGEFGFGWQDASYGIEFLENGPTVFGGPIESPVFIPGTYVMTSGTVDFEYSDVFANDYDPNIGYSEVIDTTGDTLTVTKVGDTSPVPEPPSFYLIAIGLIGIVFLAKRSTPSFG